MLLCATLHRANALHGLVWYHTNHVQSVQRASIQAANKLIDAKSPLDIMHISIEI